ncbi:uncharacterized protein K02A2.6-like [Haliotis rubra]|uniref:uncharacterized protein K02A2.6-like n=1 Tax=Haliotis rubra TaxID=36100 RepID=UPI001EE62CCE|nr:uncharacterized protein K02A2.6-like [Haliotis rubra]
MVEINQIQSKSVEASEELHGIVDKYPTLFSEGLGTFKGVEAKIYVEAEVKPLYFKARPVPYALKEKIEKELDKLQAEGTIEPIEFSEWAAPIVPIVKTDTKIRICGDYKVTVNKVSKLDNYPIPKTDDLYATLGGGEEFTKLDLSQAYQQIKLEENSKKYVTINTHKGLYRYNKLPYGVSSAQGIFKRSMENLLRGLPRVLVRVDDILITGRNRKEHLATLDKVLQRLAEAGLKLKRKKCIFLAQEVVYLGYRIDKEGIHPVPEKVMTIKEAPEPTSVTELKSYLGMLNYYGRFMSNLSTILAPLHQLLQTKSTWSWGPEQQKSFNKSKELLCSADVLNNISTAASIITEEINMVMGT